MFSQNVKLVVLATCGLSLKGIWARLAYAEGLDVDGVLFYRSALSTPLFVIIGVWALRRVHFSGSQGAKPASVGMMWVAAGLGAVGSVGMYCDFQSIAFLGAGVSRVILFGFPLIVMSVETVVARQAPPRHRLLGFAVAWIGLALVAGGHVSSSATASWGAGMGWAFASLVLYGLFVASSVPLARRLGSARLTSISNLATGIVIVGALLLKGRGVAPSISSMAFFWVSVMVVVSTVVPYFLLTEGIRKLGGSQVGMISMLGPPLTVGVGCFTLGERLSLVQLVGAVVVVVAVCLSQSRMNRPVRTKFADAGSLALRPHQ